MSKLLWDENLIALNKAREGPSTGAKPDTDTLESEVEPPSKKSKKSPLQCLMEEELNSDTSDKSFIDATVDVVPGNPVSELHSAMRPIGVGEEEQCEAEEAEGEKEDLVNPEMPESHQDAAEHQEENIEDKKSAEGKATTSIIDDKENSSNDEEYQGDSEESESESEDEDESEGEDEGQDTCQTWKTFHEKGRAKTVVDDLQNILGGCKKQRHAIEHAQNIRRLLNTLKQDFHDATLTCILAEVGKPLA